MSYIFFTIRLGMFLLIFFNVAVLPEAAHIVGGGWNTGYDLSSLKPAVSSQSRFHDNVPSNTENGFVSDDGDNKADNSGNTMGQLTDIRANHISGKNLSSSTMSQLQPVNPLFRQRRGACTSATIPPNLTISRNSTISKKSNVCKKLNTICENFTTICKNFTTICNNSKIIKKLINVLKNNGIVEVILQLSPNKSIPENKTTVCPNTNDVMWARNSSEGKLRSACPWDTLTFDLGKYSIPRYVNETQCMCQNCVGNSDYSCKNIYHETTYLEYKKLENGIALMEKKTKVIAVGCYCEYPQQQQ